MKKQVLTQWSGFTNHPDLWYELELHKTNSALWVVYHVDHSVFVPNNPSPELTTPLTIDDDLKKTRSWTESPYIFVIDAEGRCADWVIQKDNLYVRDSTFSNHERFNTYLWWFCTVVELEKQLQMTSRLTTGMNKPRMFDVLLGRHGTHREHVYKTIHSKQLESEVIMSYSDHNNWIEGSSYDTKVIVKDSTKSVIFNNNNENVNMSCFLPWKIYNKTYYTLVAETTFNHIFLTEKTVKPILAKRLFIMIGARHTLFKLHSLGFKTFGDVIDESYDNEILNKKRWSMAMDQFDILCKADPRIIEKKIKHIVEHNKKILINKFTHNNTYSQVMDISNKR